MRHLTIVRAISVLVLLTLFCQMVLGTTPRRRAAVAKDQSTKPVDWSTAVVESTMKRLPTVKDLGVWNYPRGLYLYGQYLVYRRTHDPRYLQYLKEWVDSHVDANGVVTNTAADGKVNEVKFESLDNMLPGNLLLLLYKETKEQKYKLAAERIRKRFDTYPRTKDGGFWHATNKTREWQLWGDGVFMSMPFLIRYGKIFGDAKYTNDEASNQLLIYASHLNDPKTGLMFHAYDESGQSTWADPVTKHSAEIWCRAMGWFGMTLIEVLELLPKDHPKRPQLIAQVKQLVTAWAKYQDQKTGLWYQIVDKGQDPANWLETSSSSMYSYVIAMAAQRGYVDKSYLNVARKGYNGVLNKISLGSDGLTNLIDICEGTNVADLSYYFGRKRLTNDLHGLGAFLIMNEKFMNLAGKGKNAYPW
ncbi:MAG TPA: glycoside hydrolase family 88 protein [Pyrinomonadaceae bacterium]|nr:glycoside hydrolase family 88 protein [Pyrinomonadaceae bacterium]